MKKIILTMFVMILVLNSNILELKSQTKGKEPDIYNPDSTFVFKSPHPLISEEFNGKVLKNAAGLDLIFSGNGFGIGFFYQKILDKDLNLFTSLYISGAKNTDEIEKYDYDYGDYRVPNKINRLYMFPLTIGIEKIILENLLTETLRPFISAGLGPSYILATPYDREYFNSFGHSQSFIRFSSFIGAGAYFGGKTNSLMSFNIRYYYIPFGGDGIASIKDNPIKDFGGLFISLSIGGKY